MAVPACGDIKGSPNLRLRARGAEPVGDVVQYGDTYRLCYIRGPEGIIVVLVEEVG